MGRPRVSDGISSQHPSPAPLSGSTEGSVVSVFGPFCLEGGVLRHGDDPLRLTPKEAGLLTALSEASGGIVPVPALALPARAPPDAIIEACCDAWMRLVAETDRIKSLCSYPWIEKVAS